MKIEKSVETFSIEESAIASRTNSRRSIARLAIFLSSVIGFFLILTFAVYQFPITNPLIRTIVSVVPYPAVLVNGTFITMNDYVNEQEALLQYLASSGYEELPEEDLMKQTILDALVNKAAINALAQKHGIKIDQARVEKFYQEVVESEGGEEVFVAELEETFAWSREDFKKRIVESIVIALQMSEFFLQDEEYQSQARAQIEQELITPGTIPETDLGFRSVSSLPDSWAPVLTLEAGEQTDIIESNGEYIILRVEDREENSQNPQLHLKFVVVEKKTLEEFVDEYLSQVKIRYFIN